MSDRNLELAQRFRKRYQDRHVRFGPISRIVYYSFLNRPSLFRFAAELTASEGYNRFLLGKQGRRKVSGVSTNTLQILQDEMGSRVFNHRALLSPTSGRQCHDEQTEKQERFNEEKQSSENLSDEGFEGETARTFR